MIAAFRQANRLFLLLNDLAKPTLGVNPYLDRTANGGSVFMIIVKGDEAKR